LPAPAVAFARAAVSPSAADRSSDVMPSPNASEARAETPAGSPAAPAAPHGNIQVFEGSYRMERSGSFAYGIRVRARTDGAAGQTLRDLVFWA
jgi:hypothetical protein